MHQQVGDDHIAARDPQNLQRHDTVPSFHDIGYPERLEQRPQQRARGADVIDDQDGQTGKLGF
jgi:hypothetical protein